MFNSDRISTVFGSALRRRTCSIGLVVVLASLPSWRANAETGASSQKSALTQAGSPALEQKFLRIEPSFWDTFGITLTRSGQRMGPGFFSVIPDDVVRGSSEAERHAGHARVWQGFVVGFGVVGLGLIGGGLADRASANEWNTGAKLLVAGGIVGIFVQYVAALARQNEIAAAVSSYNEDLVRGTFTE
jgi:MFS family permease